MKFKLFFIPLTAMPPALVDKALALLSEDERTKVARYRSPQAQNNGLVVRAALRSLLSTSAPLQPNEWCFEYGNRGKPSLTQEQYKLTGLDFNLSHSGDWLLIALSTQPECKDKSALLFGVDIERERVKTDIHPILNHYFSPAETNALLALGDEKLQRQRFFDLWALKESYIKATGLGLAQSLKSFAFKLLPDSLHTNEQTDSTAANDVNHLGKKSPTLPPLQRFDDVAENGADIAKSTANHLPLFSQIELETGLSVNPDSTVKHADLSLNSQSSLQWQSVFGRLTEEYRFALTIGSKAGSQDTEYKSDRTHCTNRFSLEDLSLFQVNIESLLAKY
ncbi:4'-phosphopantetheinyl transferase family protein [Shewanella acanthi]|uniref:4'-phosphopantetheinyl transferase family protein n=1 Tax=Shewanella acanthi TaxID=2864212 RepID=UPI001C6589DD|nr:4'-phosphopantetheinyl transferase superfamily protein [Shewanella acanthi]QYJ77836.1 4'-phosphopantetheinyl transferase superfamily protein [Shewanella acanthi]